VVCGLCASVRISFGNALVAYSANNTDVTDYGGYDSLELEHDSEHVRLYDVPHDIDVGANCEESNGKKASSGAEVLSRVYLLRGALCSFLYISFHSAGSREQVRRSRKSREVLDQNAQDAVADSAVRGACRS
jgi:hypothetical protein